MEEQRWIIAPLLDAGLELDEITELVVRLGVESAVGSVQDVGDVVRDHPPEVRRAWHAAIGRMLELPETGRL